LSGFSDLIATEFNTNTISNVTPSLDVKNNSLLCFGSTSESGAHSNHILTLQHSFDGSNWIDTTHTLTGAGIKDNIQTAAQCVRVKVTTAEGALSLSTIFIQAK